MKRLVLIATVIAAIAVTLVISVAAASGPGMGHGPQAGQMGVMPGAGDMLQTHDRIQLHVDAPDGVALQVPAGPYAWLPEGATIDSMTRDVQVDGTVRTVTATFAVTLADGSQTTIERVHVWEQQSDGSWELTSAPDCPYR